MKQILYIFALCFASLSSAATLTPIQLLNPSGSTSGQTIISSGPSTAPAWGNALTITGGTINNTPIGASTPNTGSFTTLAASSTVSGAGFSTYLASPPPIGGTTPNTGAFTTLSASGLITPSSTAGIFGTQTNNNATAGSVGEAAVNTSSPIALSNGVAANITALTLSGGDWELNGSCLFQPAGSTVINTASAGISSTSATLPSAPDYAQVNNQGTGTNVGVVAPSQRFSLSGTTTINIVAVAGFSTSTLNVVCKIRARRAR